MEFRKCSGTDCVWNALTMVIVLSLFSAVALSIGSVLSKRLTLTVPARQLIGPLLLLNGALVAPLAPFATWQVSPEIVVLHAVEIALLLTSSLAVWDLFDAGAASATVTAQALSPLPAAVAVAIFLPMAIDPMQAVAAVVVVAAVIAGLRTEFPSLSRGRTLVTLAVTAVATGTLTVTSRLLLDAGVEIVPIYLIRTTFAAGIAFAIHPPVDVPVASVPRLAVRAMFVTAHFLLVLVAVRAGSPAVVQTILAVAPLLVLTFDTIEARKRPSGRMIAASVGVLSGVALILLT